MTGLVRVCEQAPAVWRCAPLPADRAYAVGAVLAVTEDLHTELRHVVDGLLRKAYTGPDFAEGVRAFLAKEKPRFR